VSVEESFFAGNDTTSPERYRVKDRIGVAMIEDAVNKEVT
jgi:hypothetical protein